MEDSPPDVFDLTFRILFNVFVDCNPLGFEEVDCNPWKLTLNKPVGLQGVLEAGLACCFVFHTPRQPMMVN